MDLANKRGSKLKLKEIQKYLSQIDAKWKLKTNPDRIVREFEFNNFVEAVEFVNKIADLAESEGHHPDIYIHSYRKVRIELSTHEAGGLHKNDFILAAKIESLTIL